MCALGAVLAAVVAVPTVRAADPTAQGAEAWRMVGYLFFAGVFILLARAPHAGRGLFELAIAAKLALPIAALTIARRSDDAITFLVADGLVAGVLILAYALARSEPRPSP